MDRFTEGAEVRCRDGPLGRLRQQGREGERGAIFQSEIARLETGGSTPAYGLSSECALERGRLFFFPDGVDADRRFHFAGGGRRTRLSGRRDIERGPQGGLEILQPGVDLPFL